MWLSQNTGIAEGSCRDVPITVLPLASVRVSAMHSTKWASRNATRRNGGIFMMVSTVAVSISGRGRFVKFLRQIWERWALPPRRVVVCRKLQKELGRVA